MEAFFSWSLFINEAFCFAERMAEMARVRRVRTSADAAPIAR